jgi:hypothetical protein
VKLTSTKYWALPAALALSLAAGGALAQSAAPANSTSSSNAAVNPSNTASADKLVAPSALQQGSNSFTEGEARSRLESAGLSDVTDLKKDSSGIWRGKAKHDGKTVTVGLDYKGSMSAE